MNVQKSDFKCYAILPAAGRSSRMGTQKLLLPWSHAISEVSSDRPDFTNESDHSSGRGDRDRVIDKVLSTWLASAVNAVVIVVRKDDSELLAACDRERVHVVVVQATPADMKASIRLGLDGIRTQSQPADQDGIFIAPADLPTLRTEIIDELLTAIRSVDGLDGQGPAPRGGKESQLSQPADADPTGDLTGNLAACSSGGRPNFAVPLYGDRQGHPVWIRWVATPQVHALRAEEGLKHLFERNSILRVPFAASMRPKDIDTPEEYEAALQRLKNSASPK